MALSYKNDSEQDSRLDPYELEQKERAGEHESIPGYDRSTDGLDDHPISGGDASGDPGSENENIQKARQREKDNQFGYSNTKSQSGRPRTRDGLRSITGGFMGALKSRKGATGGIIGMFALITVVGGGLLGPGMALVHIKEVIENKINTMASVVDTRMQKVIAKRMSSIATTGKCSGIKIACKFSTFSDTQLASMKEKGITVQVSDGVDADGKPKYREITAGETPGKEARLTTSDGKSYKASEFASKLKTDPVLRSTLRDVFPTRFAVWNDKIASAFTSAKKLTKNPKWTDSDEGGDPKENQKEINKNVAENNLGGETPTADTGEYSSAVDEETKSLNNSLEDGTSTNLNSEASSVLDSPDTKIGGLNTVKNFVTESLNPAGFYVGACTTRSYLRTIVTLAKVAAATQAMRFAFQIMSTADKIKAGKATPSDVEAPMNMLNKQDANGNSFGDSVGYHYVEYGKTTDTPVTAALSGGALLVFLISSLHFINSFLGGDSGSSTSCNGFVQVGVSILATAATLLTGGAAKVAEAGAVEGGEVVAKGLVQKFIDSITAKLASSQIKTTLKEAGRSLVGQGKTMLGFFLAGMLVGKYLVPYVAHLATGTLYSGDADGDSAIDTTVSAMGTANAGVSQSRGMTTMTPDQALVFNQSDSQSTATYVADMQRAANPFNLNDPYSVGSNMGYSLSTFLSSVNIFNGGLTSILSLPGKIVSSVINPNALNPSAYADDETDQKALMAECQDTDATQDGTIATDPFCNPLYGFDDMNALQNYDPEDVATAMYDNGYIDENGNPTTTGPNYAQYVKDCFTDSSSKVISSLTDNDLDEKCYKRSEFAANTNNYNTNPSVVMAKSSDGTDSLVSFASYTAACKDKSKPQVTLASAVIGAKKSSCDTAAADISAADAYTMFHLYQIDSNVVDQMDDPYTDAASSPSTGGDSPSSSTTAPDISQIPSYCGSNYGASLPTGDKRRIVCSAWKLDGMPYQQTRPIQGADFMNCYLSNWAGSCATEYPTTGCDFDNPEKQTNCARSTDCSGLVLMAIRDGIGLDLLSGPGAVSDTAGMGGNPHLQQQASFDDVGPGDIGLLPGTHTEVIVSVDKANKTYTTMGEHEWGEPAAPATHSYNDELLPYKVVP